MAKRPTTTRRCTHRVGVFIGLLVVVMSVDVAAQQHIQLEFEVDFESLEIPDGVDPAVARDRAISDALHIIQTRLIEQGVSGAAAYSNAERHIVVQLPATEENLAHRESMLSSRPPELGFHASHPDAESYFRALAAHTIGVTYEGGSALRVPSLEKAARIVAELRGPLIPLGLRVGEDAVLLTSRPDESGMVSLYLLERDSPLTSEHLAEAHVVHDDDGTTRPYVMLRFDELGREVACQLTGRTVDRLLAITLDGEVLVAPLVREPICGGEIRLDLGSDVPPHDVLDEASELAMVLRSGTLRSPLRLIRSDVVGPAP